jgi:predicted dehydrogenase
MANIFGIVGGGWRAAFFIKVSRELPDLFQIPFVVEPDEKRGEYLKEKWGVRIIKDINGIDTDVDFLVLTLPPAILPGIIEKTANKGFFVLSETFAAENIPAITDLYHRVKNKNHVQFSEQYWLQPHHAARLKIIHSGFLGDISQAQISAAHGYHGISLIRKYLGLGFENCRISGWIFRNPIVRGPNRKGYPENREVTEDKQQIAIFDFGGKWGLFDFTEEQYFSGIRGHRVLIRGEKGEIANFDIRYLLDHKTPVAYTLQRTASGIDSGLGAPHITGYSAGDTWFYRYLHEGARLSDDEIAVAAVLEKMGEYVRGGKPVYSMEEGLQDQYLQCLMKQAMESGKTTVTETQEWAKKQGGTVPEASGLSAFP